MVALSIMLGGSLGACGGGGGGHLGARGLPLVELERVPVSGPDTRLERVLVSRRTLRVEVSPESDTPQWRVIRQLTLSHSQVRRLAQDARTVHGWKRKPADSCPGLPKAANVGELVLRVGRRETLCPPTTAQPLLALLGAYLPGSPRL